MAASEKAKLALVTSILLLATFSFSIPILPKAHAAVTIDTKNTFSCSASSQTQSVSFTTSTPNDLLILGLEYVGTVTINGVADGHLSWNTRLNGGNSAVKTGEFYAFWTGSGAETITVTFSSAISNCALLGVAVTGIDSAIPFDGIAQGSASASSSSLSVTVTTNHISDLLVGFGGGATGGLVFAPGTGFSAIDIATAQVYGEDENTGTQTGQFSVGLSRNGADAMAMVGDALCPSPCAPVITRINPSSGGGQSGIPIEIDGQAFTGLTTVSFCNINVPTFTFVSDNVITFLPPPVPIGTKTCDIQVNAVLGSTPLSSVDQYTFITIGGRSPNPVMATITSVQGPGGVPIPPQLADQGVLSLMAIIAGSMILSATPGIEKQKKRKDSFT